MDHIRANGQALVLCFLQWKVKTMNKPNPGAFGVFLCDTRCPAWLWQYEGLSHEGMHVFSRSDDGKLQVLHKADLIDFWPLTLGD